MSAVVFEINDEIYNNLSELEKKLYESILNSLDILLFTDNLDNYDIKYILDNLNDKELIFGPGIKDTISHRRIKLAECYYENFSSESESE